MNKLFGKRCIALLTCVVMAITFLTGCGAERQEQTTSAVQQQKETWTFVDQAGNEVTVKTPVGRMVVLQHHSLDIICQIGGQDKIVGVETWKNDLVSYLDDFWPVIKNLPTPGTLKQPNVRETERSAESASCQCG